MLKNFPRGTVGAYRVYFSGPQLKKQTKPSERRGLYDSQARISIERMHTLVLGVGRGKWAEGKKESSAAPRS